jgi:hypothetical protein
VDPKFYAIMLKGIKNIRIIILLMFALFFTVTGCATGKKNPFYAKKRESSHVNTSQLGRNKYYFSTGYQKRLVKSVKK